LNALAGIRLARHRHIREIDAIARHPACRGWTRGPNGEEFSAHAWMQAGASFYLFTGGWLCAAPRNETEVDLHMAALPGFRGPNALADGWRVVEYLLDPGSPFVRAFARVDRHNRAVRSILTAAGFRQISTAGNACEYVMERTA